jgi:soluble lytic murein transglycosylase
MQLRRGTARDVSRELGDAAASGLDPLIPDEAIRLGTAQLANLVERYDGLIVPALAAYNAGPAAVDRWLPAMPIAGDVWLENIPFNETREYVRRVLWHSVVFAWLEGDRVNAREWLEEIAAP